MVKPSLRRLLLFCFAWTAVSTHCSSAQTYAPDVAACKAGADAAAQQQRAAVNSKYTAPVSVAKKDVALRSIDSELTSKYDACDQAMDDWIALHPDSVAAQMAQAHLKNQQALQNSAERKKRQGEVAADAALYPVMKPVVPDAYYVGAAQDSRHGIQYVTPIFTARGGMANDCGLAYSRALKDQIAGINFSAVGTNDQIVGCYVYATKKEAETFLSSIPKDRFPVTTFNWTYNAIGRDGTVGALFERHVEGRGATKEAALADGKDNAVKGFASDIAQWGPTRCSDLAGRVPLWFCDVDFWVKAKEIILSTFPRTTMGFGKTMAEAVWTAKESSQNSFPTEIQHWETPACEDLPSRRPRWKCSVDSVVQVYKKQ